MTCGIYLLTHRETGRNYVGQSVNIEDRWRRHVGRACSTRISKALRKYGWDAFDATILEVCVRDELNASEAHWIARLDCLSPNGFNLTTGGGQARFTEAALINMRRAKANISIETRAKLSKAFKGRQFSEATIEKMRSAAKLRFDANPDLRERLASRMRGKKLPAVQAAAMLEGLRSPTSRAKMSEAQSGRKHSPEVLAKMLQDRGSDEWRKMCAKGAAGKKQTPEQIAKRVAATLATKLAKKSETQARSA